MYKAILVPLDGSKGAEAILPHVEELAQRYDPFFHSDGINQELLKNI